MFVYFRITSLLFLLLLNQSLFSTLIIKMLTHHEKTYKTKSITFKNSSVPTLCINWNVKNVCNKFCKKKNNCIFLIIKIRDIQTCTNVEQFNFIVVCQWHLNTRGVCQNKMTNFCRAHKYTHTHNLCKLNVYLR